jgi:3',5'-cyclic AMP phosphodiesterase CpdA
VFRIVHISDLHLEFDESPSWRELAGKRMVGYHNWRLRRRHRHKRRILDRLMADVASQRPDHIVISGDLVNLALPGEFRAAADWLRALGRPERISVVPGNHDAYVRMPFDRSIGLWRDYMTGDEAMREWFSGGQFSFPYVRVRGQVAFIGLSSAVPTPPLMAYGTLGRSQIERLAVILRRLAREDLYRIVVVHHPPLSASAAWWTQLTDDKALQAVLKSNGAELVLHGHLHRRSIRYLEGPKGITPVVGVPSASLVYSENRPSAAYHIYNIDGSGRSSSLEILTRSLKAMGRGFSDAAFAESSALPEFLRGRQAAAAARAISL